MENEEHYDFNSTSTPSMNPTPHPAWEEEFDEIIFGGLQNDWRVQVTYSEKEREIRNLIRSLLKEERTATLCTRCHNPFQDHHWRISHRGEHYHTGCLEKTPARVTQLIEATRVATLREVFKELEKHNFKNLQVEDSIIKRLQHKLTSEL